MLEGLRVLDFSQNLPGPYATFLLASWGADVIKLEPPKGDPARTMQPFFSMVNRGKRSVVLDLRDVGNRPALEALMKSADVIIDGFRPGVMERLGADYARAKALNPRVVYCSISAFGQDGPLRAHPGHDLNLQAMAGICDLEQTDDGPRGAMVPVADLSTSLVAVSAISAALLARERTGDGTYLDVAMLDAVLSWGNLWGVGIDFAGETEKRVSEGGGPFAKILAQPLVEHVGRHKLYAMPQYGVYECRGGGHLSLGIVDEKHFWRSLCEVLDLGPMGRLPMPALIAVGPVVRPLIARRLRKKTADQWLAVFRDAGVPAWPVRTAREALDEPQVKARGFADARGWMRAPLPGAAHLSDPPERGEHTDAILSELGVAPTSSAQA